MSSAWNPTTNTLAVSRTGCGRVTLQNGDVLVVGGWNKPASTIIVLASCELLDHATQTWSTVGSLGTARVAPSVILLNDGTVLCAGGSSDGSAALVECEVYDPAAKTWSVVGPMSTARFFGAIYLLGNGKALVAGGGTGGTSSCEIYDPVTKTWSNTGSLPHAYTHPHFGTLGDTRPIFVCTQASGFPGATETFTFNGATWDAQPNCPVQIQNDDNNASAILQSGDLLLLCPLDQNATAFPFPNVYRFRQSTNTWSTGAALAIPHNTTPYVMWDGTVLIPGGMLQVAPNINTALCDIYNPVTNVWTSVAPLPQTGVISADCGEVKGPILGFVHPVWVGIQHDGGAFSDNAAFLFSLQTSQGATMSNMQTTPFVDTRTVAPALTAAAGTFVYNMQGIGRASLQLNTTFSNAGDTDVVTLKISNDGVHFVGFSTAKTATFTGGTTDSALFELGNIDYVFLQVSWADPSAHTFSMQGVMYGIDGRAAF